MSSSIHCILDIKGCLQFISLNKSFAQIFFTLKLILLYDSYKIFLLLFFVLNKLTIMEEDILNCLPTVMFRGTPCS